MARIPIHCLITAYQFKTTFIGDEFADVHNRQPGPPRSTADYYALQVMNRNDKTVL